MTLGVALCFVPLFGVLGYELALVTAGFAALSGLDLGATRARAAANADTQSKTGDDAEMPRPPYRFVRDVLMSSAAAVGIACVPGVIAAIHGVWAPTCDWGFGIRAYALMPLSTAALGGALGHTLGIAVGVRANRGPWWLPHRGTWVAVVLPIGVLAAAAFWRFYSEPPVFIYSPLIGYFPGNIYDEDIVLGRPLLWSRLESVVVMIALIAAAYGHFDIPRRRLRWKPEPSRRAAPWCAVAATAVIAAVALRSHAGALGYAIDGSDIQAKLGGRVETAHFVIYYADVPEIRSDIRAIARDHEFRYLEVVAQTQIAPEGKIASYYFASPEQKARWFGAKHVEMAKPWRHEIYLDHRPFPHPSLRHELAHVVASAFGDPLFGVAATDVVLLNPGLIEGLAVALDWPGGYDGLTPHESVRAMQLLGFEPRIADLFSIQFLAVSAARGYTTAGSFLRFLLEHYGAGPLRELYASGGDFASAYKISQSTLEAKWRAMITSIDLPTEIVEGVRERFRAGSVFSRPCPHAVAAKRAAAMTKLTAGDQPRAVALMRDVCKDAPHEPRHQLELGEFLAAGSASDKIEARALWTAIADDRTNSSSLRAEAFKRLARLEQDPRTQIALIERARSLPLDPNDRRALDAEAYALRDTGPAGSALRKYFQTETKPTELEDIAAQAAASEPAAALPHYLLGLQKANAGKWAAAARELDQALSLTPASSVVRDFQGSRGCAALPGECGGRSIGLPGSNFVRFAARRLAVAAYRADDAARLQRAITAMYGPDTSETDHLLGDDWKARRTFDATGHL